MADLMEKINWGEVTPPVKQVNDSVCWAAALEWWQRAHPVKGIFVKDQNWIMNHYGFKGLVSQTQIKEVYGDPRWGLDVESISTNAFTDAYITLKVDRGPMLIGYNDPNYGGFGTAHVVVVYKYLKAFGKIAALGVMDPWTPYKGPRSIDRYKGIFVIAS